jgi:hypothetical protein
VLQTLVRAVLMAHDAAAAFVFGNVRALTGVMDLIGRERGHHCRDLWGADGIAAEHP